MKRHDFNAFIVPLVGKTSRKREKGGLFNKESFLTTPLRHCVPLPPQGGQLTANGFTLIELLVVVLIIGILAAVALPQYQKAVTKSRLANAKQTLFSIKKAEEAYYLSNNQYTEYMTNLDIDLPSCPPRATDSDVLICDNYFMIDPLNGSTANITAYYCPKEVREKASSLTCAANADFYYRVWLENSEQANYTQCVGKTSLGKIICAGEQ